MVPFFCICRNSASETIEQKLIFVGSEEGKLVALRQSFAEVWFLALIVSLGFSFLGIWMYVGVSTISFCHSMEKINYYHLKHYLNEIFWFSFQSLNPPVLLFVQNKERVKELYNELKYDEIRADVIHADLSEIEVIF